MHRYESDIYFHSGLHCMWFVSTTSIDAHDIITGNKSFGRKPVSISCHRFICLCFLPLWIIWFYFANIWGKLRQNGKSYFIGWNPAIVDGARWNRISHHFISSENGFSILNKFQLILTMLICESHYREFVINHVHCAHIATASDLVENVCVYFPSVRVSVCLPCFF